MKKAMPYMLIVFLVLFTLSFVQGQEKPAPDFDDKNASIMRPDPETLLEWIRRYKSTPLATLDEGIQENLRLLGEASLGTSLSLLNYLTYNPVQRNQGSCGNCWNWAGTGVLEIAHRLQNVVSDRLSTQFLNSCKLDKYACCGGTLEMFADWYRQRGIVVPWANGNAAFADGSRQCENGASSLSCGSITSTPNYVVNSITPVTVPISTDPATSAANIKNVLNQNKAIWYGFFLPNQNAWNAFIDFWNNQGEDAVFDMAAYCGATWDSQNGGGHAVVLLGYDDSAATPYWLMLNSWGTGGAGKNNRPNGLFRIKMNQDYGCQYYYNSQPFDAFIWQTLNVQLSGGGSPTCTYSFFASNQVYGESGGPGTLTVNTQSGCPWTATKDANWIAFTSAATGSGPGTVSFTVSPNSGTRRTGEITVRDKNLTITQSGPGTLPNLLRNPSFENGEDYNWINNGFILWEVPCPAGIDCAYQGNWLAWLGGYDYGWDYMYQEVTIPASATKASLKFMYAIDTWEYEDTSYDYLTVEVSRADDPYVYQTLLTLSNRDWTDFWKSSPTIDIPSQFYGIPITIDFYGETDESNITSFYIDNVVLTVETPETAYPEKLYLPLILNRP